ncbi:MAG TPA: hypothetical protein PK869_10385, partial [Candidatus Hydrogenedentes bacterium]|nr:hypothetical protein [Candidatus Hydrogenedentota bacterium]
MPETTVYEYFGYLRTILDAPNEAIRDSLDHVAFSAQDLAQWSTKDFETEKEWKRIPAKRVCTDDVLKLTGRFEEVRRIDSISKDDPSFWVPLSTIDWSDARFPVDLQRFPIAEITYRCTSDNAHPAWVWKYPGGLYVNRLPRTKQWRTLARRITHWGIPQHIDTMVVRLYSTMRSTESMEIESIRFRAMSQEETDACERDRVQLAESNPVRRYPVLDEFMPLGTCMNAETVRRCAEMLGMSLGEYWWLTMEDLVTHHHNCILVENIERMTRDEWGELHGYAEKYGIKIVPSFNLPVRLDPQETRELIDTHIKPLAHSSTV